MEKDIYYYKPELPSFVISEDYACVRLRVLKFVNGKIDSFLADWDYRVVNDSFYDKELLILADYTFPQFYCIIGDKDNPDTWSANGFNLKDIIEEDTKSSNKGAFDHYFTTLIESVRDLRVPIFKTEEEARDYVFSK